MATWDVQIVGSAPQVYVRCVLVENWTSDPASNYSNVTCQTWSLTRNGTRTGTWDWNNQLGGTSSGSNSATHSGDQYLGGRTINVAHDVNGYGSVSGAAWLDAYYGNGTAGGTINLTRIPLAPTISSIIVDTIKSTSARIGGELSSYGHGTSATLTGYWRIPGGSWNSLGAQADAAGYNYWTITGLKPNTTYEYTVNASNNNTDTANGWYQTFKTKPVSGLTPLLMNLISG